MREYIRRIISGVEMTNCLANPHLVAPCMKILTEGTKLIIIDSNILLNINRNKFVEGYDFELQRIIVKFDIYLLPL